MWKNRKELQTFLDEKFKSKVISGSKEKQYIGIKVMTLPNYMAGGSYNSNCMIDDELDI